MLLKELKGVNKTIKNKTKEQKEGFLNMFLGTLSGNLLSGKGTVRAGYWNKKRKEIVRTAYGNKMDF